MLAVAVAISVVVSTDRISALRPAAPALVPMNTVPRAQAGRCRAGTGPGGCGPRRRTRATAPEHSTPGQCDPRSVLCPRLAAFCQVMIGVAMAYTLILML